MTEIAKILSISGKIAEVACEEAAGCKSCSGNALCSVKTRRFEALLSPKLYTPSELSITPGEPKPGDRVEVYIPPGKTIVAGFMVLMVPLLLFIASFALGGQLLPHRSEALHALFGIAGLGLGFLVAFGYNKVTGKKNLPIITKVVEVGKEA
jgi:positive regulator of sigma E activity